MYTQHVTRLHTPPLHRLIIACLDTHRHTQSSPVWLFPKKDPGFQEVKSKPLRRAASSHGQARQWTFVCQPGYLNLAPASATAKWGGLFHREVPLPFFKYNLNICKFLVHILLKASLKDYEHYFASM